MLAKGRRISKALPLIWISCGTAHRCLPTSDSGWTKRRGVPRSRQALPAAERLADLTRMVEHSRERERLGRNVIQLSRHLAFSQARLAALQDMPQAVPVLDNTAPAQSTLKRIDDLRKAAAIAQGRIATIDEGLIAIQVRDGASHR